MLVHPHHPLKEVVELVDKLGTPSTYLKGAWGAHLYRVEIKCNEVFDKTLVLSLIISL